MSKRKCKTKSIKAKSRKTKRHGPSNRIAGTTKSFTSLNEIKSKGVRTMDEAALFRNDSKDSAALRLRETVCSVSLSDKSIEIIESNFCDNYFRHYVLCIIDFYKLDTNDERHVATVKPSYRNVKDARDSMQHAKMDCFKCAELVLKVKNDWDKKGGSNLISRKLTDLSTAIKFCAEYISFLSTKRNCPKNLSTTEYEKLVNLDSNFSKLYILNNGNNAYTLNRKYLKNCAQETLTYLFCAKYNLAIH